VKTNGGIWRYHPQRQTVEMVCDGTTNPWGMDWNEHGEGFFINTVIGHLWQIIPGAHYRRMHGNDLNPHTYEIIEQHADHVHWAAGEAWNSWQKLGTTDATSSAGGGHAHTGLMFYGGDNWPDDWRGKLLAINFNGRRLNVENVSRTRGSGYVGRHAPDIGFAADPFFRGIDLLYGADGGVFVADWSDTGECHDDNGVFRQSGRIYKITHGPSARPAIADVAKLSPQDLLPLLAHQNEFFARQARKRLQELAAAGVDLTAAKRALGEKFSRESDLVQKLRALWSLHAAGGADAAFLRTLLSHSSEHVRTWAIRFLADDPASVATDVTSIQSLVKFAATEPSPFVRLALASALQRLPLDRRAELARPLLRRSEDATDHNLPQMLWYGVEPLGTSDPATLAALGAECELPMTRRCIARRLTGGREKSDAPLGVLLTKAAADARWQADVLGGMRDALKGERKATPPAAWSTVSPKLAASTDPKVKELFRTLGAVFGDPLALESTRAVVLDTSASVDTRRAALRSLIDSRASGLRAVCETVLTLPGLAATAADGLALENDPAVPDVILARFSTITPAERSAVLSTLVSRPAWAGRVLDAIANDKLPRAELTVFHARQIRGFNDAALTRRLGEVWGASRDSDAEKLAQIARWKKQLTPAVLAKADKVKGRGLYNQVCAACHVLNGEGGKIGPELTGAARDNLDYLLQNILDPSAAVPREYQLVTLNTKDGRALSGFIRSRTERVVVLQTLAEAVSLPAKDIADTETTTLSLMPEGLLEALPENDVRDLIAYLMQK
jgi:putative heme-binding domain-containing protein